MNLLFPFTVSISRAVETFSPTGGASQTVTVILSGLAASIQLKRDKGYGAPVGFPSGTNTSATMPLWEIFIPNVALGTILEADMVTDQSGLQYKTDAVQWTPLGVMLGCTPYQPTA